ncbi:MAG: efflux RND transporter periplasmic adaptor subunit [Fulvivirga sp.]|uniref:efflux RND transporter periplasmic adaptor subunit n=1 Tax=Fulvivirga sp. TaxID=1931237 RepID=UPI0032EE4D5B
MNNTSKTILISIIILGLIAFIVYPKVMKEKAIEENVPSSQLPQLLEVNAVVAKSQKLDNDLRVTGSLTSNESVILKPEVSGRVIQINFKEGQRVKKGQLLIALDASEVRAEIEKLDYTKKLNEDNEYRQKQLLKKEAISQEEYEMALTTLNTTLAEIKVREVQLQKHLIRAPFDGIAGLRKVSPGSYISSSDELVTVYSINPIKIDFSVPGKYAAQVNVGDKLQFQVDGYDNESFQGSIYAIEPQIDPTTRSINLRATSANEENKLLPGQFAKIRLTISTFEEAILIPTEAVIPELNSKKVFVSKNGKVETREIETGIRMSNNIQVTTGLNNGDTVITTGILQLRTGMPVNLNLTPLNE